MSTTSPMDTLNTTDYPLDVVSMPFSPLPRRIFSWKMVVFGWNMLCFALYPDSRQAKGRQHYDGDVNMPAFLTAKNLKPFIHSDLAVTSSQVEFKTVGGTKAFGYAAELLPKVCEVFLKAESAGALLPMQKHIGEQCRILLIGLASTGVVALVDEATGYQDERPRDALQAYLEKIISKELAAWVKKFPDEFYENIYGCLLNFNCLQWEPK